MRKILSTIPGKLILFIIFALTFFTGGLLFREYFPTSSQKEKEVLTTAPDKTYEVTRVLDGDTIEIETGEKIRYQGIDAPEPNKAYGLSAQRFNEQLVLGKKIKLEGDSEEFDLYGRRLSFIWINNELINETIIREGYAKVYIPNHGKTPKYIDRLREAEKYAQEHHYGMWMEEWMNEGTK